MKRWVLVGLLASALPLADGCSTSDRASPETNVQGGEAGAPPLQGRAATANAGGSGDHMTAGGAAGEAAVTSGAAPARAEAGATAGSAPARCEAPATCEAYCGNVNEDRSCTSTEGVAPCVAYCSEQIDHYMPEACRPKWQAFLACAACAEISCDQIDCPGNIGCADPPHLIGCDGLIDAALACAGPCIDEGEQSGSNPQGSYRALRSHCECPAELAAGAAEAEPCVTAEDCAQQCCACSGSDGMFLAQQCQAGHCVGGATLCSVVEPALGYFCNPT